MRQFILKLCWPNRVGKALLLGCALILAVAPASHAQTPFKTTICKKTNPSPDPWGTSFGFTGANGSSTGPNSFNSIYVPNTIASNPFPLKDGHCQTFDISTHDKFNKFTESGLPWGWTLSNITCTPGHSAIRILGANSNPGFQPGDNTVAIDQTDPTVTCTFTNTLACFRPTSLSLPPCTRPGDPVALDMSTSSVAGNDPNWTVAPGNPAKHTTLGPWTALASNWITPSQASTQTGSAYTYTRGFHLPCDPHSYQNLQLTGHFAADNNGQVLLNGNSLAQCTGSQCFNNPSTGTSFTSTQSQFVSGYNQLTVKVGNDPKSYTGLSVVARLTATCGKECVCGCPPGTSLDAGRCVRP